MEGLVTVFFSHVFVTLNAKPTFHGKNQSTAPASLDVAFLAGIGRRRPRNLESVESEIQKAVGNWKSKESKSNRFQ
jgi:hypothetical protein